MILTKAQAKIFKDYIKDSLKLYLNSFKNKSILSVLALNCIFILLAASAVKLIIMFSKPWVEIINRIDLSNIASQSEAQLQTIVSQLKGFVFFSVGIAIIFVLFLIVIWSLSQGMIYNILAKAKFGIKKLERFLLLNLVWFPAWLMFFFIVLFGSKPNTLIIPAYAIILLFLHFSFILYILFAKEKKFNTIKKALKLGITKIHHFLVPYLLIVITFIIISQLNYLNINSFLMLFIFLVFFSWLQTYISGVIIHRV